MGNLESGWDFAQSSLALAATSEPPVPFGEDLLAEWEMGRRCVSACFLCKTMPAKPPTVPAGAPLTGRRDATARFIIPARSGGIAPHSSFKPVSVPIAESAHKYLSCELFFFFPGRLKDDGRLVVSLPGVAF